MSDTNFRHYCLVRDRQDKVRNKTTGEFRWGAQHQKAFQQPQGSEKGIVELIHAAANYADWHRERYDSKIGDDGVLGDHWADIVRGILGLLNGDCGRLDCGTLDGTLRDMLAAEGFDTN